jgi:hypothetical protein
VGLGSRDQKGAVCGVSGWRYSFVLEREPAPDAAGKGKDWLPFSSCSLKKPVRFIQHLMQNRSRPSGRVVLDLEAAGSHQVRLAGFSLT